MNVKHMISFAGACLLIIVGVIVSGSAVLSIFIFMPSQGISNVAGYCTYHILTNSMAPAINRGDLVVVDGTAIDQIKEGDIIVFFRERNITITHRVVEVQKGDDPFDFTFITKGDSNAYPDEEEVSGYNVVGVVRGCIPNAGFLAPFLVPVLIVLGCGAIIGGAVWMKCLSRRKRCTP